MPTLCEVGQRQRRAYTHAAIGRRELAQLVDRIEADQVAPSTAVGREYVLDDMADSTGAGRSRR